MIDATKFRRRVSAAVKRSNESGESPGFCLNCGDEVSGVEPDARDYKCESCGERQVAGAEEILFGMSL